MQRLRDRQYDLRQRVLPFMAFLALLPLRALADRAVSHAPATAINQRVIAALPKWHGRSAEIVDHLDLTSPFGTQPQWTFVAALLPGSRANVFSEIVHSGPLAICFVHDLKPQCSYPAADKSTHPPWRENLFHFYAAKVVFAGANHTDPLLLVTTGGASGVNGNHPVYTHLFSYNRRINGFQAAFHNMTYSNNNQETRFVEHGPLRGDVVSAVPTVTAPYAYWISVYARNREGQYSDPVLRYRSATRYGDGNHLAVIDSEMPNILEHLDKWKPGDPLPIPHHLPSRCAHRLFLRGGEEWCPQ